MNTQTKNEKQALSARQQSIFAIFALTAKGDLQNLKIALNGALDSGLTINNEACQ